MKAALVRADGDVNQLLPGLSSPCGTLPLSVSPGQKTVGPEIGDRKIPP